MMTIHERAIGSATVLTLKDKLVLGEGDEQLKSKVSELLESGSKQIIIDMGDVAYVDSAGLGALVSTALGARHQGCALQLVRPSTRLQQLIAMARLQSVICVCESEEQALGGTAATV